MGTFKAKKEPLKIETRKMQVAEVESASWGTQFCRIMERTIKNEFRDPTALRGKLFQLIFNAIVSIMFYEKIATNKNNFAQNLMGTTFYLGTCITLPSLFGNLEVFNAERPVFIRERQSNTYSTSSYFFARSLAYIPQEIVLPLIFITTIYFVVHLNESVTSFFFSYLTIVLVSWMGSAYGLFISALFADLEVALALVPVFVGPFLLVGGYFAPLSQVPDFYKIFEYLSMFKYGYEGFAYAQFSEGFNTTGMYNSQ